MRGIRPPVGRVPHLPPESGHSQWRTVRMLLPYLWAYRARAVFAVLCLVAAKLSVVGVPVLLKHIVDRLSVPAAASPVVVPISLIVAYGALRLATSVFTELREFFFARVTQSAVRALALQTFRHLHSLSLRYHLERRTGAVTREIDHGIRGLSSLVSFTLYSIVPTLVEIALVFGYLLTHYEASFALIVAVSLALYVGYTLTVTNWRTKFRRQVNELDAKASSRAVDSLLNFETVKYFNNEDYEAQRYDATLAQQERVGVLAQQSLNILNSGQQLIIAIGLTLMLWRASDGVASGRLSIGDLVLVNAFMLQMYVPLNFLGVIYRELRQALADVERMFRLLHEQREISDRPDAVALILPPDGTSPGVRFEHVNFGYDARRQVLFDLDLTIAPGTTCAVVGPTGSGKSTLGRLLFRFYEAQSGRVLIDGQDVQAVTQHSLRAAIGIVPQDTVLFNDTIEYNIGYGRPGSSHAEIVAAARMAHIHEFIESLPDGYRTLVGERGLKLSGGEKQRVAIARTLLKNPPILVLDEATSALDSRTERVIQSELADVAANRTTLVIAHRLSTIVDAAQIVVMERGRIVERGTHEQLLARQAHYARLWALQQREDERDRATAV